MIEAPPLQQRRPNTETLRETADFGLRLKRCPGCGRVERTRLERGPLVMLTDPPELYWQGERAIDLPNVEGRILEALMRHRWCGHALLRGLLRSGRSRWAASKHIDNLRGKLDDITGGAVTIRTRRGEGYEIRVQAQ